MGIAEHRYTFLPLLTPAAANPESSQSDSSHIISPPPQCLKADISIKPRAINLWLASRHKPKAGQPIYISCGNDLSTGWSKSPILLFLVSVTLCSSTSCGRLGVRSEEDRGTKERTGWDRAVRYDIDISGYERKMSINKYFSLVAIVILLHDSILRYSEWPCFTFTTRANTETNTGERETEGTQQFEAEQESKMYLLKENPISNEG